MSILLIHRRRLIWAAAGILLLTGLVFWVGPRERQPALAGKPILDHFPGWMSRKAITNLPMFVVIRGRAMPIYDQLPRLQAASFQSTSSNSVEIIPWLLRVIRKDDALLKRVYLNNQQRLPQSVQRTLPVAVPAEVNGSQASWMLAQVSKANPKAAVPLLRSVLEAGTPRERVAAASSLGLLGRDAEPAMRALAANLSHKDPAVRRVAFNALLQMGKIDVATFNAMTDVWFSQGFALPRNPSLVAMFSQTISRLGRDARSALPSLARLRADTNPAVRIEAIHATWRIDPADQTCVDDLLREFSDGTRNARRQAGSCLARNAALMNLKPAEVLPSMIAALRGREPLLAAHAATILAHFQADALPALPELKIALRDDERVLRDAAARAIEAIGPAASDAIPALVEALDDPTAQTVAARALGVFGPAAAAAAPKLVALLTDLSSFGESTELPVAALRALGRLGVVDDSIQTILRRASEDANPDIQDAARETLVRLYSTR